MFSRIRIGSFNRILNAIWLPLNVPAELQKLPQWVVWRWELRKDNQGNEKRTKPPYRASDPTQKASSTDPDTWATFEEAITAFRSDSNLAGIGFVFTENDPYAGVDLDNCVDENGNVAPWAAEIIRQCWSYCEVSPSGKGVKIICRTSTPIPHCGKRGDYPREGTAIEMYDKDRYFTVTGNLVDGPPKVVRKKTSALRELSHRLWPQDVAPQRTNRPSVADMDDKGVLALARAGKSGKKFRKLFDSGDISGYPSDSEADLALCSMLARVTQDADQIEYLMRQSALSREKWDTNKS